MLPILLAAALAFHVPPQGAIVGCHNHHRRASYAPRLQEYDLSRPAFDLLELRSFRRETLMRYDQLNRVEQLRIIFFASNAVVALLFPYISRELFFMETNAFTLVGSGAAALLFGALAAREKSVRGSKMRRYERESLLGELSVCQPGNALGGNRQTTLQALRERQRVIAVYGSPSLLSEALASCAIYRRRLKQSSVVLVLVEAPGSGSTDGETEAWRGAAVKAEADGWLWRPSAPDAWSEFFDSLLTERAASAGVAWVALSLNGRSCGSGVGLPPWDEVLGTRLPPLRALSPDLPAAEAGSAREGERAAGVLAAQAALYGAITSADADAVVRLCAEEEDAEVTSLAAAGRMDGWETVLLDGATKGMRVASQDALLAPGGREAWSTAIEFPNGGVGSLLCTQRWVNVAPDGAAADEWRLCQHRTIPYTPDMDAAAALRCDRRGCCVLQRAGPTGPAGMPGDGRA